MSEKAPQRIEAALTARPDLLRQIESNRTGGPSRVGRPARTPHMDAARARDDDASARPRYGVVD
ncbi:Uncharacterised protein (plasmid) [Tsukamurella tyrosinosolvens]|uniref:Uncharacterized protein n=1 Tax=Tsukamurella tyrosinosolvens TaxID=57704 RepID=A0A1H4I7V3_TSUTY|nr:hypothetical protein [Tsukamurella tyrosinosolvens]KXO92752.1 hypothetical protein AXK58_19340 [Tsukamurella tyrosinosolvens]SEB29438.1 hypothetical protein SAMN04489793_0021 [Tsukamurella tyrosinosolvens]VEH95924.1 Uncharacterised protein [Tsukamurella tyrosinosolvens]